MTKRFGWSKNVLVHQIENQSYERYLLNQTNFDKTVPEKIKHQAKLAGGYCITGAISWSGGIRGRVHLHRARVNQSCARRSASTQKRGGKIQKKSMEWGSVTIESCLNRGVHPSVCALCQERARRARCCTQDEGRPSEVAL